MTFEESTQLLKSMTPQELIITANISVKTIKALGNDSHMNGLVEVLAQRLAEAEEAAVIMRVFYKVTGETNEG